MRINHYLKKSEELKLTLKQWLLLSCCFSCLLLCIRVILTNRFNYSFLPWNLFLAFVPYFISEWLYKRKPFLLSRWKTICILLVWLLFIPNSFYIVTDLFHLDNFNSVPKWFDLLLLFSFAWNGLVLGILSVRKIELILRIINNGKKFSLAFMFAVMWLNSFGIYIGRYLRYNSWDVITQPFSLFSDMIYILAHPFRHSMQWGMITTWAVFITLFYFTIKKLTEQFASSVQSN